MGEKIEHSRRVVSFVVFIQKQRNFSVSFLLKKYYDVLEENGLSQEQTLTLALFKNSFWLLKLFYTILYKQNKTKNVDESRFKNVVGDAENAPVLFGRRTGGRRKGPRGIGIAPFENGH